MAVCPFAKWLPIPENAFQAAITPTQVIVHSAVDAPGETSLHDFFARADEKLESHFFIQLDGDIEQYVDTEVQADANFRANVRAISIETEDEGNPDQRPWTDAQLASIVRLLDWIFRVHPLVLPRVCPAWDAPGVGYHTMWGAPSNWTPVHKTCPGAIRITQFKTNLTPWINAWEPAPDSNEDDDMSATAIVMRTEGATDRVIYQGRVVGFSTPGDRGPFIDALRSAGVEVRVWPCSAEQFADTTAIYNGQDKV